MLDKIKKWSETRHMSPGYHYFISSLLGAIDLIYLTSNAKKISSNIIGSFVLATELEDSFAWLGTGIAGIILSHRIQSDLAFSAAKFRQNAQLKEVVALLYSLPASTTVEQKAAPSHQYLSQEITAAISRVKQKYYELEGENNHLMQALLMLQKKCDAASIQSSFSSCLSPEEKIAYRCVIDKQRGLISSRKKHKEEIVLEVSKRLKRRSIRRALKKLDKNYLADERNEKTLLMWRRMYSILKDSITVATSLLFFSSLIGIAVSGLGIPLLLTSFGIAVIYMALFFEHRTIYSRRKSDKKKYTRKIQKFEESFVYAKEMNQLLKRCNDKLMRKLKQSADHANLKNTSQYKRTSQSCQNLSRSTKLDIIKLPPKDQRSFWLRRHKNITYRCAVNVIALLFDIAYLVISGFSAIGVLLLAAGVAYQSVKIAQFTLASIVACIASARFITCNSASIAALKHNQHVENTLHITRGYHLANAEQEYREAFAFNQHRKEISRKLNRYRRFYDFKSTQPIRNCQVSTVGAIDRDDLRAKLRDETKFLDNSRIQFMHDKTRRDIFSVIKNSSKISTTLLTMIGGTTLMLMGCIAWPILLTLLVVSVSYLIVTMEQRALDKKLKTDHDAARAGLISAHQQLESDLNSLRKFEMLNDADSKADSATSHPYLRLRYAQQKPSFSLRNLGCDASDLSLEASSSDSEVNIDKTHAHQSQSMIYNRS